MLFVCFIWRLEVLDDVFFPDRVRGWSFCRGDIIDYEPPSRSFLISCFVSFFKFFSLRFSNSFWRLKN